MQKSRIVFNEPKPRWGDMFDFVMISAGSTLYLTVYNNANKISSLLSMFKPGNDGVSGMTGQGL